MSQENVEIVLALLPAFDKDFVQLFRDDEMWAALAEAVAALFHPDFESANNLLGVEAKYTGLAGFRTIWLDWLRPWATYRIAVDDVIDCGDRVVLLSSDSGLPADSTQTVTLTATYVFTVRAGRIARIEGFAERADALKAVGLEE